MVVWKAKQAADVRRARLRHVVEMLHMAKRPFAAVDLVLSDYGTVNNINNTPQHLRRRIGRNSAAHTKHSNLPDIRPVAVETTADSMAAISTVFVRLPGKSKSPVSIALGSSLVLMSARQLPIYQRPGGHAARRRPSVNAGNVPAMAAAPR